MHVLLEFDLEGVVKSVDLLDEVHLHSLGLLDVLVTRLLLLSEEVVLDLAELGLLLLDDRLDHLAELLGLRVVGTRDVVLLQVVLLLQDAHVAIKLLMEATHARFLEGNEVINVDQMVPQSHLVLLLGLVEVSIKHLKDGVLGVDLTIVVLLIDLNLLL